MKKREQFTRYFKEINTQSTTLTSPASKVHFYLHSFKINLATHYKESKTWLGFTFENGIKEVESLVANTSKVLSDKMKML